jgi:hypothetical protein
MGLIEDAAMDASKGKKFWIFRENLERREEGTYLRFKLSSVITKRDSRHKKRYEVEASYLF